MRTAFDLDPQSLDDEERRFLDVIGEHGWFDTAILDDEEGPGFSYTTGFWSGSGHPEILFIGLNQQTRHDVLWDIYRAIKSGCPPPVSRPTSEVFANAEAVLLPVSTDHYREYLGWNRWFYNGDDFPCLQLIWSDREGRFPWSPDAQAGPQPDLSTGNWGGLG
ncbi:hypothetical protein QO010_002882 [Caulobacter ginsengisoli]|uniref:DUF4262 domain-containing protein n=1 Tax=Caulobacter ginsengisoli TaxID=400775 RepID=A0ABU0ISX4_9CAUL|nr:DUF4262 domain-containing protein [Caulobacter ginsengisoli]MDQ0465098.1 hypothetical protein [Caulobacter ginsengisoli]